MSYGRSTLLPPALPKESAQEYECYKKDFIYALKWHLGAIPASVKTLSKILPDILHEKWLFNDHTGRVDVVDTIDSSEVKELARYFVCLMYDGYQGKVPLSLFLEPKLFASATIFEKLNMKLTPAHLSFCSAGLLKIPTETTFVDSPEVFALKQMQ